MTKMMWTTKESIRILDEEALGKAECVTIYRDERNARLAARFSCINESFAMRHGRLATSPFRDRSLKNHSSNPTCYGASHDSRIRASMPEQRADHI